MRSYIAFTKKEILEYVRTFKMMILVIVFLILGFMSPVTAKYTPEIIDKFMPQGMNITLPEPTILDSWTQFFKNITQLALIVIVIMFSGLIANELSRGTLVNMLTKGMPRRTVILAKFTSAGLIWTICYWLAFAVTLFYSELFWDDTKVLNLGIAALCVWFFGLLLIGTLLLGGVLFNNYYGSLLLAGVLVVAMLIISMLHSAAKYSPYKLVSFNMELLEGTAEVSEVYAPLGIAAGILVIFMVAGIAVFDKKKI